MSHIHDRAYQPRIPAGLVIGLVVVVSVPLIGAGAWLWIQWAALDLALPWLTMALRVALFTVPSIYVLAFVWQRWGRRRYIDAYHIERLTLAQRSQGLPAGVQSVSWHDSSRQRDAPQIEHVSAPALPPGIPTFAQLLNEGKIGPGRDLILGYNAETGQPITGDWNQLYSCGVGAMQGAGKTWLLVFLLTQSAAAGGRLIVCDLHAGDPESLATRLSGLERSFMRDVADTPKAILSAFELANAKLEARKANTARWPIVLVCDEWTSLLRTPAGAKLEPLIQNIAEQGRKFNVNGLLSAQAWTKDASSAVRNQLTSHYVLRQRPDEARYQLGMRAAQLPNDIRELPDACGYFLNVRGEMTKVIIPRMTAADVARAASLIDRPASAAGVPFGLAPTERIAMTAEINGKSTGNQNQNLISTAPLSRKPASPEAERAAALFVSGKDVPEIIRELRGDLKGRAYQAASAEIHDLLREGMQS